MSRPPLLVGNAQAFWGDDPDAPPRLVRQQPDLNFLTLEAKARRWGKRYWNSLFAWIPDVLTV
jgi:hypothetical protein